MRNWTILGFLIFLVGVVLFLLQMWFHPWGAELFAKILITNIALFVIVFVAVFLVKETKSTNKINKGTNSLD